MFHLGRLRKEMEVSVIIPCLNEEETIGACINKALTSFEVLGLEAEVIVVDNGSQDNSTEIAQKSGAKVIHQQAKGYGNAYLKGFSQAKGKFIIMADGDDTYNLLEIKPFIDKLREGYDFVIGSRFKGKILPGGMPWLNRYIGNPILTGFLNLFFQAHISDAHCGFRAITKDALERINLKAGGMEFASEMIIDVLREKLKIAQVPITYHPRKGRSKLKPISDAWRHMRFMLLYSPTYLFLLPGGFLFGLGLLVLLLLLFGSFSFAGHRFDVHAMVLASFSAILGFQILNLGLYSKTYAHLWGFQRQVSLEKFYKVFKLEKGIILGLSLFCLGFLAGVYIFYQWFKTGFGALNALRLALFALTFMVIGIQTIFSSFFLSLMSLQRRKLD